MTVDVDGEPIYRVQIEEISLTASAYEVELGLYNHLDNRVEKRYLTISRELDDDGVAVQLGNETLAMLALYNYPIFMFSKSSSISSAAYAHLSGGWYLSHSKIITVTNARSRSSRGITWYYPQTRATTVSASPLPISLVSGASAGEWELGVVLAVSVSVMGLFLMIVIIMKMMED